MHCYTKCAGNMILKSGHFCFSWIDNAISCGKGIELDAEGRLHQESLGCKDRVRQTDDHTCICSMVHLLKMVRDVCVHHIFVSYVYDVNNVYLLSFYVQFPDIQTQIGGEECTHIVQLITYGSIQRDGTTESHI